MTRKQLEKRITDLERQLTNAKTRVWYWKSVAKQGEDFYAHRQELTDKSLARKREQAAAREYARDFVRGDRKFGEWPASQHAMIVTFIDGINA